MKWKYVFSLLAIFIMVAIVGAQDAEIASVTGIATDDGVEFPSELTAGYVNLTFENNRTEASYTPVIARLNDGVTMDAFMEAASSEDSMSAVLMVTLYGGTVVAPGESLTYTSKLSAGNYVLLEFSDSGETGTPNQFTVTENDMMDEMAAPQADVNLAMLDFAFGVPAFIPAGEHVWHLENVGDQWHEMSIFKAPEGIETVADVRAAMAANQAEPEQSFFWAPMGVGAEAWVTLNLDPGTYVVLCFLPDLNSDYSPHMDHGMIQVFTVE